MYGVGAPLPHRQKAKPAGEFARQDVLPANPPRQHKSLSTGERGRHSNFTSPVHHSPEGRSLSHFRDPDSGTSQPPPSEPQEALDVSVIPAVENENVCNRDEFTSAPLPRLTEYLHTQPSPIYGSVRTARHSVFEPNRLYSVGDDFGFPVDAGDHLQRPTGDCRTYRLLRHYVEVIGPWVRALALSHRVEPAHLMRRPARSFRRRTPLHPSPPREGLRVSNPIPRDNGLVCTTAPQP